MLQYEKRTVLNTARKSTSYLIAGFSLNLMQRDKIIDVSSIIVGIKLTLQMAHTYIHAQQQ
jgi:hypothetical protein